MSPLKSVTLLCTLLFALSCEKKEGSDETPPPPPPTGTGGTNYQAQTVCNYNHNDATLLNSGWTKAFEDNFDNNLSNWTNWTSGSYNSELQYYQAANLQLSNGVLAIIAKKEDVTGTASPTDNSQKTFRYTSARIESKNVFSANATTPKVRIMARVKLPKGHGMSSGFLNIGDNWPTQGQIDHLVSYGQSPAQYVTNYYYSTKAGFNSVGGAFGYINANTDLTDCYHVFETEWTQNALNYYLDGKLVETKTSGGYISNLFDKKQRLCFYLAVSSSFITRGQIQPGTMYVDWVKVFTSK